MPKYTCHAEADSATRVGGVRPPGEEGVIEAEGTAEPIDEVASGEYTGTDCLAYTYEKERRKERADLDEGTETDWDTVDSGSGSVPFYVSDDTGQAAVDPEGATFSLKPTRVDSRVKTRKYERSSVGDC